MRGAPVLLQVILPKILASEDIFEFAKPVRKPKILKSDGGEEAEEIGVISQSSAIQ